MNTKHQSLCQQIKTLPASWVDRIFSRLQGIYGHEFTGFFSTGMVNGIDAGLENAKFTWAEELADFANKPEAIAYALAHLPERMPNCIKFKELCKGAPRREHVKIPHKLTPEQIESNKARAKQLVADLAAKLSTTSPDEVKH